MFKSVREYTRSLSTVLCFFLQTLDNHVRFCFAIIKAIVYTYFYIFFCVMNVTSNLLIMSPSRDAEISIKYKSHRTTKIQYAKMKKCANALLCLRDVIFIFF